MQHKSGAFNFDEPTIKLSDICWNLAHTNRFNGATDFPWSVAEHTLLCYWLAQAEELSKNLLLPVLLHDAHEYVLGDPNGLIVGRFGPWYHEQRNRFDGLIAAKFGFSSEFFQAPSVKRIDRMALWVESTFLFENRVPHLWEYNDKEFGGVYTATKIALFWQDQRRGWSLNNRKTPAEIANDLKQTILSEIGD